MSGRSRQWLLGGSLTGLTVAAVFVTVPVLTGVPARLVQGCGRWIVAAGLLELLSVAGFVAIFKLVFAASVAWQRATPAALRALGAVTVLPGGGLIGPAMGAWSVTAERPSLARLGRCTTSFVILTSAPEAIVVAVLGVLLWLRLPAGPHQAVLTILPALLAGGLLLAAGVIPSWPRGRAPGRNRRLSRALLAPVSTLAAGVSQARDLLAARDWKLGGAIAYYAFDNAVLWAAFHAFGHAPAVGIVVMGYLIGSLAAALPVPGGLGVLDGGLIGALVLYGAPAAPAAAAVLLYRGISLSVPVVLGAVACIHRSPRAAQVPPGPERLRVVDTANTPKSA